MINLWEIQEAFVAVMQADSTLMGLVTAIRDEPLEMDEFPYITIGDTDITGDVNKSDTLFETNIVLNIWSSTGSRKQVKQIMDRLVVLFNDNPPSLSSGSFILLHLASMADLRDPDGFTYKGVVIFRGLVS